nr:MAG TPA: hypothetical protein [Bacteriophage sp.]
MSKFMATSSFRQYCRKAVKEIHAPSCLPATGRVTAYFYIYDWTSSMWNS